MVNQTMIKAMFKDVEVCVRNTGDKHLMYEFQCIQGEFLRNVQELKRLEKEKQNA